MAHPPGGIRVDPDTDQTSDESLEIQNLQCNEYNAGRQSLNFLENEYRNGCKIRWEANYNYICHPDGEGWKRLCNLRQKFEKPHEKELRLRVEKIEADLEYKIQTGFYKIPKNNEFRITK